MCVSALSRYFASSYTAVVLGRFVVGLGVAVSGVADVTYLRECAPIEWRGSIVSVNEACISLGFLLAYIAGYLYANEEEWRIVFGAAGILALVQFIGENLPCIARTLHGRVAGRCDLFSFGIAFLFYLLCMPSQEC